MGYVVLYLCQALLSFGHAKSVSTGRQSQFIAAFKQRPPPDDQIDHDDTTEKFVFDELLCAQTWLCTAITCTEIQNKTSLGFKRSRPWPPVAPLQGYLASPTWALNTAGLCRRQVLHINTQAEYLNGKSSSKKKLQLCDPFLPSIFKCYFYLDLLL